MSSETVVVHVRITRDMLDKIKGICEIEFQLKGGKYRSVVQWIRDAIMDRLIIEEHESQKKPIKAVRCPACQRKISVENGGVVFGSSCRSVQVLCWYCQSSAD